MLSSPLSSSSSSSSSPPYCSCQTLLSSIMFSSKTSPLLHKFHFYPYNFRSPPPNSYKFRCIFDHIAPKFSVTSSLTSVFTTANIIAAAAAASSTGAVHGAVTSTITHVAVTAVAIASGACLSTKVDFLWPKVEEHQGSIVVEGVDVTGYPIFSDAKVQKAIGFAKKAHHGQFRKTGDPYLVHCIHTGRIVAMLVPSTSKRAVDTVVAGILHDVVDDTNENLHSIGEEFGEDVAKLVAGVSRLSYVNQLLRRHRRINENQSNLGQEEANNLRVMLLGMIDDPRVVLIKLADRLHNMRTIYALPALKAQAVAQETLLIWCSLASRLGLWALKAELEDLCFAVLQPQLFQKMRADLASMWSSSNRAGYPRRISNKFSLLPLGAKTTSLDKQEPAAVDEDISTMKDLLEAVLPFDILLDRKKGILFLSNLRKTSDTKQGQKVIQDAEISLASLIACEEALERELFISTSYIPGMEVTLSGRLKSLYSIYSKMKRKDVGISEVYDARALRVVVGDKNGTLHGPAIRCCYSLLTTVHRLWSPIDGEFDDYIVNPKPSGYQSLHTAVQGPDNAPLEVQIRTQKMHEYAEHGLAAHWLYKETRNELPSMNSLDKSETDAYAGVSEDIEGHSSIGYDQFQKYRSLKIGHPVLRVEGSHLLTAVIIRVDKDGRELLVAVGFALAASEAVADRRSSFPRKRWEAYARLYKKVSDEWWCEPGHGDWCTCLEKYTLCRDGIYHKQDQFERLLPTFIQVIDLTKQEESEYWDTVSAVFEGRPVDPVASRPTLDSDASNSVDASINNKVRLLRTMLQWEEQLRSEASLGQPEYDGKRHYKCDSSGVLGEVVVIGWPHGEIMRLTSGSTAADAARRVGFEGKLVLVNGQHVLPNTQLKDGDVVEVRV
ncbi:GTP pyrophosphokinase [Euphorbia peplus]|nr:GTP pyrophosphokinase [Euphorbia peplus]